MNATMKIAREDAILGEYTPEHVQIFLKDGSLRPTDLFWDEELNDWRPLEELNTETATDVAVADVPVAAKPSSMKAIFLEPSKTAEVLRWIAVLPGGILAGILILFPLHWVLYFTLVRGSVIQMPMDDMASIEHFLSPVLSSIFFVFAGALIAPKKQLFVSYVLFSFSLLVRIGMILVAVGQQLDLDLSTYGILRLLISSLAGALGILFVKLKTKTEEKDVL